MQLIDADNAAAYLQSTGRVGPHERVCVRRMAGGVSNEVLYVERGDALQADFVLKQARPQLRVAEPWFCRVERIWRETETLRACQAALANAASKPPLTSAPTAVVSDHCGEGDLIEIAVPQLLFEDRDNYAFAMTAAPPHQVWKQRLLEGIAESAIAAACGRMLAALHANTWRDVEISQRLGDRSYFNDLRIDPYYRHVAQIHPHLRAPLTDLIDSLAGNCLCLVHGDFSPKNLLIYEEATSSFSHAGTPRGVMLVDFEVGHFGDPAFDLGFFLTHLALKSFWAGPRREAYLQLADVFWQTYRAIMDGATNQREFAALSARTVHNFAACMLARIDGKSKVEYLVDEPLRETVRRFAAQLLLDPPAAWDEVQSCWPRLA